MTPADILRRKASIYAKDTTEFYGGPDVAAELEQVAKEIEAAAATTDVGLRDQVLAAWCEEGYPAYGFNKEAMMCAATIAAQIVAQRQADVARPDDDKWLELSQHWEQYWRKSYETSAAQILESWFWLKDILASNESTDDDRNKAWGDLEKDIEKLPSLDAPASASEDTARLDALERHDFELFYLSTANTWFYVNRSGDPLRMGKESIQYPTARATIDAAMDKVK